MATIRLCDWTKERLAKDAPTFEIAIDGQTFEVGEAGRNAILEQLEGENAPGQPRVQVVERTVEAAPTQPAAAPLINVETNDDPFEPGPGSMPQMPMAEQAAAEDGVIPEPEDGVPRIEIPEDTKKRLPMPTEAQSDKVIRESVVFEEGTLSALNPGGKGRQQAVKKLAQKETVEERNYMNQGRGGINVGSAHKDDPRFYQDDE